MGYQPFNSFPLFSATTLFDGEHLIESLRFSFAFVAKINTSTFTATTNNNDKENKKPKIEKNIMENKTERKCIT